MMAIGMSPIEKASPAADGVLANCSSSILTAAVVFNLPSSMALWLRSAGGVRIMPQNTGVIAGPITESCQSIHWFALARALGSAGAGLAAPELPGGMGNRGD